jgi:hypothetical protein
MFLIRLTELKDGGHEALVGHDDSLSVHESFQGTKSLEKTHFYLWGLVTACNCLQLLCWTRKMDDIACLKIRDLSLILEQDHDSSLILE